MKLEFCLVLSPSDIREGFQSWAFQLYRILSIVHRWLNKPLTCWRLFFFLFLRSVRALDALTDVDNADVIDTFLVDT